MLARVPFWGWFLLIVSLLYSVYNPMGYSLWHMWTVTNPMNNLPFKHQGTAVVVGGLALVTHGCVNSMSRSGLLLLSCVIVLVFWSTRSLIEFDVLGLGFWSWALQPTLALILTLGWQWPRIWRRSTGAVSVTDPDTPT